MLTVRMSWMDVEKSCSADVMLPKDSKDIPPHLRNKLYNHRVQVASMIRRQLATIKRQLDGDQDDEHDDATKAVEAITALIKGQRYRDGKTFTCYLDGTSHEGCQSVAAYNAHCRQSLDALLAVNAEITAMVPDASEFDVRAIDALMDEEAVCVDGDARAKLQEQIEAARNKYNDKASKVSRYLASFMQIRNAKLGEGFDPNAAVEEDTLAASYAARSTKAETNTNADAEAEPTAVGSSNNLETAETDERVGETNAPAEPVAATEDDAKVEEDNAAIMENTQSSVGPTMRDGTVAAPSP